MNPTVHDAVATIRELLSIDVEASVIVLDDGETKRTFMRRAVVTPDWEIACAQQAPNARQAALAVPLGTDGAALIHVLSVDLDDGIDILRCAVDHAEAGPTVGVPERFTGKATIEEHQPGRALVASMSGGNDG